MPLTETRLLLAAIAAYALAVLFSLSRWWWRAPLSAPAWAALASGSGGSASHLISETSPQQQAGRDRLAGAAMWLGLGLHTLALGTRWQALGHGPFTTLYEVISSNLWSLTLVIALLRLALPELRGAWLAASPVLFTLAGWALVSNPGAGHLPPTYATPLLYVHAVVGKAYLGLLLAALALAAVPLARRNPWARSRLGALAADARMDELAHRCAAAAFIFDSLMLIVGACWAQDAWGRYWAWDPLESWAFLSWLALAITLHTRVTVKLAPHHHALMLALVFVLAFLTFFGVPFISTAPHKGAV
jgi:ABC-type transport system involved in cytochrome c biogenesis permease subunit